MRRVNLVCFGGGVNSVALVLLMIDQEIPIDDIVFADTGAEHPYTYEYMEYFEKQINMKITIVRDKIPLYDQCIKNNGLPSIAFGLKQCSVRWKVQPFDKYVREKYKNCEIHKYVGIDAGETHRFKSFEKDKYIVHGLLIEHDLDRNGCENYILSKGLELPRKSSCFFCPAKKKHEILEMLYEYPELVEKAIDMERNAKHRLNSIKGLGRSFSWEEFVKSNTKDDFMNPTASDCLCEMQ